MLLSLFPLGAVLFPGSTLPLHIFEPRYRLMIGECIEQDQPFGVLLIRSGNEAGGAATPHEVGTTARIARVQRLADGTMNIATVGVQRFRVLSLDRNRPYLSGEVEYIPRDSIAAGECETAAEQVRELFSTYYRLALALADQWTRRIGLPSGPEMLADFVASRLDVAPQIKQQLLELDSTAECLAFEANILTSAVGTLAGRVRAAQRQKYTDFGRTN